VSKLKKNRGKRSTSFQKKKCFFCEKGAKSSGGVSKLSEKEAALSF
jgi:hypothetical protein